jgi:hypothetical protein
METIFSLGFPRAHEFTDLTAMAVAAGFRHAMVFAVAMAVLVLIVILRSSRKVHLQTVVR